MSGERWYVAGFDGQRQFFAHTVPANNVAEEEIRNLLQRLASKYLSANEIVECIEGSLGQRDLLKVKLDTGAKRRLLTIGDNPHFTAALFSADEQQELGEVSHQPPKVADWNYV